MLGLYVSRITNLDHIWTTYDHIWSIRKGVRYAPPPWYKKNRLGSGVKVEISCPLIVWDLAQQTASTLKSLDIKKASPLPPAHNR